MVELSPFRKKIVYTILLLNIVLAKYIETYVEKDIVVKCVPVKAYLSACRFVILIIPLIVVNVPKTELKSSYS